MSEESERKKYLEERFVLDIDDAVFSAAELALLARYGFLLRALESGTIKPITKEEEHFLQVVVEKAEPLNEIQAVWLKYKRRKLALAEADKGPHYELRDGRQEWYSDEAYRRGIHFPRGQKDKSKDT